MNNNVSKVAIVTIDSMNYGNKLQNYALQEVLISLGCDVETLKRRIPLSGVKRCKGKIKEIIQMVLQTKGAKFNSFRKKIRWSKDFVTANTSTEGIENHYDFFVAGSDQIWNPHYSFVGKNDFLVFARPEQKIAYSASLGVNALPDNCIKEYASYLSDFEKISMREEAGAKVVSTLTGRKIPVVLDPTLMLDVKVWRRMKKRPPKYPKKQDTINEKYVLIYSLGEKNQKFKDTIKKIEKEGEYQIIDIRALNAREREWEVGPSEFLYLIDHADIVLTDSFHASVFSILFHTNFLVFERPGIAMGSRLDTLLQMTGLEVCKGDLQEKEFRVDIDFNIANKRIAEQRCKSLEFLKKAMDLQQT